MQSLENFSGEKKRAKFYEIALTFITSTKSSFLHFFIAFSFFTRIYLYYVMI